MGEFTHKGWFYFVPILCAFDDSGGFTAEMRLTGWQWPITLAIWFHNGLCAMHGKGFDFPVWVTGELK